jgi:hypothetical protein
MRLTKGGGNLDESIRILYEITDIELEITEHQIKLQEGDNEEDHQWCIHQLQDRRDALYRELSELHKQQQIAEDRAWRQMKL